jgi:hypothetical protein
LQADSENSNFKAYVMTEYVEFFRTKNKFTREWRKNIAQSEEMLNQTKKELKRYE